LATRSSIVQSSPTNVRFAVYSSLALSVAIYLVRSSRLSYTAHLAYMCPLSAQHFCHDVITTITKETGKPCFRVVPPEKQKPQNKGKGKKA
jgi:hypothetical protein